MRRPARLLFISLFTVLASLASTDAVVQAKTVSWTTEEIAGHKVWYQNFQTPPMLPQGQPGMNPARRYPHVHVEVARWSNEDVPVLIVSDTCSVELWDPHETHTGCKSLTPGDVTWTSEDDARRVIPSELVSGLIASARGKRNVINRYGIEIYEAN